MNILFYAEPLPIRNSFHQHAAVAGKFSDIIVNNIDYLVNSKIKVRILANQHVNNELLSRRPELRPCIQVLDHEDDLAIEDMLVDWRDRGISMWKEIMRGMGDVSTFIEKVLSKIKNNDFNFDVLVCWGQNGALEKFCPM